MTIRSAALHPPLLLLLAACGALSERRRAVFLVAGFLGGLAPAVLAWGPPSTHRMLMAFPFIALAAGCALDDLLVWRRAQVLASAALVVAVAWYGIGLYFSDEFWPPESRGKFDWPRTALVESLPLSSNVPVILMRQTVSFGDVRRLVAPNDQALSVENWFPPASGAVYAFSPEAERLRPFYESLFGARVESFGPAFKLTLEPADWSWLRQHGWSYEASCGSLVRRAQVPVLFQPNLTFASLVCEQAALHTWRARWDGPPTSLRLHTYGHTTVDAGGQHLESNADGEAIVDFAVEPGMDLRVSVTTPPFNPWVYAALLERTPAGERVPMWERALPAPQ